MGYMKTDKPCFVLVCDNCSTMRVAPIVKQSDGDKMVEWFNLSEGWSADGIVLQCVSCNIAVREALSSRRKRK